MKKLLRALCLFLTLGFMLNLTSLASDTSDAETELRTALARGSYSESSTSTCASNTYTCSGGGYKTWGELINISSPNTGYINEDNYLTLTADARQNFLTDMYNVSSQLEESSVLVTAETQNNWLVGVQNCSGVGSQLIATLFSNAKPDFVTSMKIIQPFTGGFNTVLGVAVLLLSLGIIASTVLDLVYMGIAPVRMFMDGDTADGTSGGKSHTGWISHEAKAAIKIQDADDNGSKVAVAVYFKKRAITLFFLLLCILYLVQGAIFPLLGKALDLLAGFTG